MDIQGVSQSVTQKLRREIVAGELPGGARLNEIECSSRLGISRPPLREAFRRLENEGLVVSVPRKGCYVAQTSRRDWEHISWTRRMIECTSIETFARRGWTEFPLMREAHERIKEAEYPDLGNGDVKAEDVVAWFEVLSSFHVCLVESSRNNWLAHCYRQLCPSLARYQVMYLNCPGAKKSSIGEHGRLLRILEEGRYDDAMPYLKSHLDTVSRQLTDNIRSA